MSITENSRNGASKKNTDEAEQVQALQESMSSINHKFLVMSSQGGVGKTSVWNFSAPGPGTEPYF